MDASTIQQDVAALNNALQRTHRFISTQQMHFNKALSSCGQQAHFIENSEYLQMGEFTIHIRNVPAGAHVCAHVKAGKDFTTFYQLREDDFHTSGVTLWYWNTFKGGWVRSCLRETDLGVDSLHHNLKEPVRFYRLPEGC